MTFPNYPLAESSLDYTLKELIQAHKPNKDFLKEVESLATISRRLGDKLS